MPAPDLVLPKYVSLKNHQARNAPGCQTPFSDVSCNHTAVGGDSA